ncbi:peptidoglycan binding domain/papain family cysteine protease [Klebsiella aerogenes]|nr:peptidoglycan binding domain/papain family cysteine protease [Klebsiella aerogenes]
MVKLLLQGSSGPAVVELRKRLAKTLEQTRRCLHCRRIVTRSMPRSPRRSDTGSRISASSRWCRRSLLPEPVALIKLLRLRCGQMRCSIYSPHQTIQCAALSAVRRGSVTSEGLTTIPLILAALGPSARRPKASCDFRISSQFNTLPGLRRSAPTTQGPTKARILVTSTWDGARFRGRGFVQLTGRSNYQKYASA